eukprot:gene28254-31360_t
MYPSRSLDNYVLVPTQAMITGDYTFPHPDGGPATQWSSMEDRNPPIYVGIMELPACVKGVKVEEQPHPIETHTFKVSAGGVATFGDRVSPEEDTNLYPGMIITSCYNPLPSDHSRAEGTADTTLGPVDTLLVQFWQKALLKAARTAKAAAHAVTETVQACACTEDEGARPVNNRPATSLANSCPGPLPGAGAGPRHGELHSIVYDLHQRHDEFDERGREIIEHMAQSAANLSRIEYMKSGKELAQGLDGKLMQIKARALNVYRGLSDGQNLGILVPMSELVSLDSSRMRREVEEMLQNQRLP